MVEIVPITANLLEAVRIFCFASRLPQATDKLFSKHL